MCIRDSLLGRGSDPPPPALTTPGSVAPATTTVPAPVPMWIGANTANNSMAAFEEAEASIGPLRFRRCFHVDLPVSHAQSCAADDWPRYRSFVSWKPPADDFKGAANGLYDAQISAWAASVPTSIGLYATVYYEPEGKMTGPEFVAMFQRVYRVVKEANPSINFGPVYTDYRWEEGSDRYAPGGPDAWWVGPADFIAVDVYSRNPQTLEASAEFQGWKRFADAKAPTLPRVVSQYSLYKPDGTPDPRMQAERARVIAVDEAYLQSNHYVVWILDQANGWELSDAGSQAAWRRVAANGRKD